MVIENDFKCVASKFLKGIDIQRRFVLQWLPTHPTLMIKKNKKNNGNNNVGYGCGVVGCITVWVKQKEKIGIKTQLNSPRDVFWKHRAAVVLYSSIWPLRSRVKTIYRTLWPQCCFSNLAHIYSLRRSLESSLLENCARTWCIKYAISKLWCNINNISKNKQRVAEHTCIYLEPFVLYLIDIPTWYRAQGIQTRFPWPFRDLSGYPEKKEKKVPMNHSPKRLIIIISVWGGVGGKGVVFVKCSWKQRVCDYRDYFYKKHSWQEKSSSLTRPGKMIPLTEQNTDMLEIANN